MKIRNTIAIRIADFLKEFPPFSFISRSDLLKIAENTIVKYVEPGELVFSQGDKALEYFFIVNQGAVKLVRNEEEEQILIDICDEGDLFGIRPLVAKQTYLSSALALEESILYCVHHDDLLYLFEQNTKAAYFLASSFASGNRNIEQGDRSGLIFLNHKPINSQQKFAEVQQIRVNRAPVVCASHVTIEQAARKMTEFDVGSIVAVDDEFKPIGILTDSDLRRQIATYEVSRQAPVSAIMNAPVLCISLDTTVADAQIEMITNDVNHLVITEDGTIDSKVLGVLAEHDLVVIQGNNPVVLIKEIKHSQSVAALKQIRDKADMLLEEYLLQEVAIGFVSQIMTKITDALYIRCIELVIEGLQSSGRICATSFCWMAIGSHGRQEQLIRTDQDHALVFEQVPTEEYEKTKEYFIDMAKLVSEYMKECGYKFCPAKMMASNPRWCMSLPEWKEQFSKWVSTPDNESILKSSIFMDYRPIYGEAQLTRDLTSHLLTAIENNKKFLTYLAKSAVETPPPLSFFRNFIVEKDGHNKNEFDIKQRGTLPLVDAARVLILSQKIDKINNTIKRYHALANIDTNNATIYQDAADAYEIMMKLRAQQGIENGDSGRYFDPNKLNKIKRLLLRNGFKPIGKLQEILNLRYQLKYLFR